MCGSQFLNLNVKKGTQDIKKEANKNNRYLMKIFTLKKKNVSMT